MPHVTVDRVEQDVLKGRADPVDVGRVHRRKERQRHGRPADVLGIGKVARPVSVPAVERDKCMAG